MSEHRRSTSIGSCAATLCRFAGRDEAMVEGLSRELIALRVARELRDGMVVNLGIGLPTLVSNFLPQDAQILLQSENGILGYGSISDSGYDPDLINAGGQPLTF